MSRRLHISAAIAVATLVVWGVRADPWWCWAPRKLIKKFKQKGEQKR